MAPRSRKRRRVSRKQRNTLRARRTYQVRGQIYSRLLFPTGDPEKAIPKPDQTLPIATDNVFDRPAPFQMDLAEFPILPAKLSLKREKKVLETIISDSSGTFAFTRELYLNKTYRLEAYLETGQRFYPERISYVFKVKKLPKGLAYLKLSVRTKNRLKIKKRWKTTDVERVTAIIEGSTLWFAGNAALVFNTFALDVTWMTQELSPGLKKDLSNLRYHQFTYDGQTYRIGLHHLCLSTCVAMLLNYYGVKISGKTVRVEDVAEAAAKYFLDIHKGKHKKPDWFKKKLDPNAGNVVQFLGVSYPHNIMPFILEGVRGLLKQKFPNRKVLSWGDDDNLMTTTWPNLKLFLGLGWPTIIADDLKGNWEHARVCCGLVINRKGKMIHAYVNDPANKNRHTIATSGKQSDLGWLLFSIPLKQRQITPARLLEGGSLPVPNRHAQPS